MTADWPNGTWMLSRRAGRTLRRRLAKPAGTRCLHGGGPAPIGRQDGALAEIEGILARSRPRSAVSSGTGTAAGLVSEESAIRRSTIRRHAEPVDVLAQHVDEQRWHGDGTCGGSGGSSTAVRAGSRPDSGCFAHCAEAAMTRRLPSARHDRFVMRQPHYDTSG
ncbi:hypothetical protein ACFV8T_34175 [Streptomyces sp. NPDC059832]|uniref:hypothetical protein n=1 Tax=Streptomyces sp. NPDC059832 TaxID=3346966 RepID=UPI0036607257